MSSKETLNKNLKEIIDSMYVDIAEIESGKINQETRIQKKLQDSLERYQEYLNERYAYLMQRNETDNAAVMKTLNRFNRDVEEDDVYEDDEA